MRPYNAIDVLLGYAYSFKKKTTETEFSDSHSNCFQILPDFPQVEFPGRLAPCLVNCRLSPREPTQYYKDSGISLLCSLPFPPGMASQILNSYLDSDSGIGFRFLIWIQDSWHSFSGFLRFPFFSGFFRFFPGFLRFPESGFRIWFQILWWFMFKESNNTKLKKQYRLECWNNDSRE